MTLPLPEPTYPHLSLQRADVLQERRRRGFGRPPVRDYQQHGQSLQQAVDSVVQRFAVPARPPDLDPALILKIKLDSQIDDEEWTRNGLVVLSREPDKSLVLFSSDSELTEFRRRLSEYQSGPQQDRRNPSYNALFAAIADEGIDTYGRDDRIGRLLRGQELVTAQTYFLDVEVWPLGNSQERRRRLSQVLDHVRASGGEVRDQVETETMLVARVRVTGGLANELLEMEPVAAVDFPPQPSLTFGEVVGLTLEELTILDGPPEGAPSICVIDSGITPGHPLLGPAVGDVDMFPATLGSPEDGCGHGTMVAGIALYGDIERSIALREFRPELVIYSARVTNSINRFDDDTLVLRQMRESIERFAAEGCRVFNISLGDDRLVYDGGKVTAWAATLDQLARELQVLIVVSAGNYRHMPVNGPDEVRIGYPRYLLNPEARIIDPAMSALSLTIGSLGGPGAPYLSQRFPNDPAYQRVCLENQPSPFTRSGAGQQNSVKPDLCEFGGDLCYDGHGQRTLDHDPGLSVVSLNHLYLDRLFQFDHGTSFAAPRTARLAAILFRDIPDATPNLVRSLLASSARVPEATQDVLPDPNEQLRVCGYGKPNLERALVSHANRVILTAQNTLAPDSFHVYQVPIPTVFRETNGERSISVALAFDPPTRYTRVDYLGVTMSFRLVRGKTLDEVVEAYRRHEKEEGEPPSLAASRFECELWPGPAKRDAGTLQKATFSMRQNPRAEYGDTYYLVVRAQRRWAPLEVAEQPYALVVTEEHRATIDVYNEVRQRVIASARVRV